MPKVQLRGYHCLRCGHEWLPRQPKSGEEEKEPKVCPKCKNSYWYVPRESKRVEAR